MGSKQACYKVVAATEFPTLEVKTFPPVLVIAVHQFDVVLAISRHLTWLAALGKIDVVQSVCILLIVSAEPNQQVALRAQRPAPFVHGTRPVNNHFFSLARFFTKSAIEVAFVACTCTNDTVAVASV
jgi:hypothetical protein